MDKRSAAPFLRPRWRVSSCAKSRLTSGFFVPILGLLFLGAIPCATRAQTASATSATGGLAPIRKYIADGWDTLTRSLSECSNVIDPKLAASESVLYLPADFGVDHVRTFRERTRQGVPAVG